MNLLFPLYALLVCSTKYMSNPEWGTSVKNTGRRELTDVVYFWDNDWPSDTDGNLDGTVLFAQSQIIPSKHGISGDAQPHLIAQRKALVLFKPHGDQLSGDLSLTVRNADGTILWVKTMNDPEDLPKHVGWMELKNVPEFPSKLENPYILQFPFTLNRLNDESAAFLASKFSDKHNNGVEVRYWDSSWVRDLYLPNGNDVPLGSKVLVKCNSGRTVLVHYPNTMYGGWRVRRMSRGDVVVIALTADRVWVTEDDLQHNAYLFGENFYSSTLEAEWVQQGMTLEFQNGNQVGTLSDIQIGGVTEVLITTLDVGMLTTPRGEFTFADDPTTNREYFQTVPATRLVVAPYEPLHLTEVMLPTGKLYTTVSDDEGGWHSGDMRQYIGKILLSHGIDLANYGIHSSLGQSERSHPYTCALMTAHNTRGVYQNGVIVHGGSGGNGMVTLTASIGNEFSHELGHNYRLGHYVGRFDGSVHRPADEINSSWQWDADLNIFTPNFASSVTGEDTCLDEQCQSPFLGKFRYGTDSMAGGYPQWANRFTFYTPYVAKRIQSFLESKAFWDPTSSTGFRIYDPTTKEMVEFANEDNGHKIPQLYRVPVTTIVGYYDPDPTRRLTSYIYPAMYGAYGFVYDGSSEADSGETCSLHVDTTTRGTIIFELSTEIDSKGMNKFHVNIATEFGAITASIYCQNELLDIRSFDGPQDPSLSYTVNGIPFADETDNSCIHVNFPATNPGYYTCDCVEPTNPCRWDSSCVAEERCPTSDGLEVYVETPSPTPGPSSSPTSFPTTWDTPQWFIEFENEKITCAAGDRLSIPCEDNCFEEYCRTLCAEREDCAFYHVNGRGRCELFKSCDRRRNIRPMGTTWRKHVCTSPTEC